MSLSGGESVNHVHRSDTEKDTITSHWDTDDLFSCDHKQSPVTAVKHCEIMWSNFTYLNVFWTVKSLKTQRHNWVKTELYLRLRMSQTFIIQF